MAPRREDAIKTLPLPDFWPDMSNIADHLDCPADLCVIWPQMRRVMRLIEAVFESARTGQVVPFE